MCEGAQHKRPRLYDLRKNSHQAQHAGALYQGMALEPALSGVEWVPIEPQKRGGLYRLRKTPFGR